MNPELSMALLTRLQLLALPRTPAHLLNRMKYKSSAKLQDEFKNIRASAILQSRACQDILSRARVVTESDECQAVVEGLMSAGTPVGLDMEGVNNKGQTGLDITMEEGHTEVTETIRAIKQLNHPGTLHCLINVPVLINVPEY